MRSLIFVAVWVTSLSAEAAASTCRKWNSAALEEGPVPLSFYAADFASGRRACPRNEVTLGLGADAVIDIPAFYANLGARALVSASHAYNPKIEVFGTVEALRLDYVQNATLKQTALRLGQVTVGSSYLLVDDGTFAVSPLARVMLPVFITGARTFGVELGAAAAWRLTDRFDLHGYVGLDGAMALFSGGDGVFRGGAGLELGAQYNITDWFGALVAAKLHAFNRNGPGEAGNKLDYLAPLVALRFAAGKQVGAELAVTLPVYGSARHDFLGMLRVSYRL